MCLKSLNTYDKKKELNEVIIYIYIYIYIYICLRVVFILITR